jgi:hypothetical protein
LFPQQQYFICSSSVSKHEQAPIRGLRGGGGWNIALAKCQLDHLWVWKLKWSLSFTRHWCQAQPGHGTVLDLGTPGISCPVDPYAPRNSQGKMDRLQWDNATTQVYLSSRRKQLTAPRSQG